MVTTTTTMLLLLALLIAAVVGNGGGGGGVRAFSGAAALCGTCASMCGTDVAHVEGQRGLSITVSDTEYVPGVPLDVTVTATPESDTKGFVLYAEAAGGGNVGEYANVNLVCEAGACAEGAGPCAGSRTHNGAARKTSMVYTWTPPAAGTGAVTLKMAFVQGAQGPCTFVTHEVALTEVPAPPSPPTASPTAAPVGPTASPTAAPTASPVAVAGNAARCEPGATVTGTLGLDAVQALADVTLAWFIDCDDRVIEFTASAPGEAWIGVGWKLADSPSMGPSDIVQVAPDGTCKDGFAAGNQQPVADAVQDCTVVVANTKFEDGRTTVAFSRALDTGNADDDIAFLEGRPVFFMVGVGASTDVAQKHGATRSRLATPVDVYAGDAAAAESANIIQAFHVLHGVLMIVAWAVASVTGTVLARFLKDLGPLWFKIHRALMCTVVVVGLASWALIVAAALALNGTGAAAFFPGFGSAEEGVLSAHALLGTLITAVSLVQPVLGYFADKLWSPDREATPIFPDMMHWWIGRILIFLAFINIPLGIVKYGFDGNAYIPALVIFLLWCFVTVALFAYGQLTVGQVTHNGENYSHALAKRRDKNVVRGRIVVVLFFLVGTVISVLIPLIGSATPFAFDNAGSIALTIVIVVLLLFLVQAAALAVCKRAQIAEDAKALSPSYEPPAITYDTFTCPVCSNVYMIPEHLAIHQRLRGHEAGGGTPL